MTSKVEGGWTGIRRRAANSALALAMLMLPSMFATRVVQAQTFTLLYSFKPDGKDSGFPLGGLIGDRAGNLYGTTAGNGAFGSGTVFKLDPTGTETVLHNFAGTSDGGNPYCTLIRDTAGNFYGTASTGGLSNLGTVFKLDVTGNESVLHSFTGGTDGAYPFAGLLRDVAGNLYGTTYRGGGFNQGTVFKLDANGQETVLYSFRGTPDGGLPWASLLLGPTGNLYGTTQTGGAYNLVTVFKVDPAGNETVLHSFGSGLDGVYPQAGLIRDVSGNLYGTTARGGSRGVGTIFKLDKTGNEALLYTFIGNLDGDTPYAGLVRDSAGNFYGTTNSGGSFGWGTIFKLDTAGNESLLYNFDNGVNGGSPHTGLVRDPAGNFYGTTFNDAFGPGTVFKLSR